MSTEDSCKHPEYVEIPEGEACIHCGIIRTSLFHDAAIDDPLPWPNYSFTNDAQNQRNITENLSKSVKYIFKRPEGQSCAELRYLNLVRKFAAKFNFDAKKKAIAETTFLKFFTKYKAKPKVFKEMVAAVSVYITLFDSGNQMQIHEFCNKTACGPAQKFLSIYSKVKTYLTPSASVPQTKKSLVESIFKIKANYTEEDFLEHTAMIEKTVKLFKLAQAAGLSTGRSQVAFVMTCSYFAWKSMVPNRSKYKFDFFFQLYKYDTTKKCTAKLRKTELEKLLLKLVALQCYGNCSDTRIKIPHLGCYLDDLLLQWREILKKYYSELSKKKSIPKTEIVQRCIETFRKTRKGKPRQNKDFNEKPAEHISSDEEVIADSQWDEYICSEKEVEFKKKLMEDEKFSKKVQSFLTKTDHTAVDCKSFRQAAFDLVDDNCDTGTDSDKHSGSDENEEIQELSTDCPKSRSPVNNLNMATSSHEVVSKKNLPNRVSSTGNEKIFRKRAYKRKMMEPSFYDGNPEKS